MSFNGTSSRVDANYISGLPTAGTVILRFKARSLGKQLINNSNGSSDRWCISIGSDGTLRAMYFTGAANGPRSTAIGSIQLNQWYQGGYSYNSSGTVGRIYLNGVVANSGTQQPGTTAGTTFNIGSRGGADFFDGLISEVLAWNRVLTDQEVSDLYFNGIIPTGSIAINLPLTEGAGTVANDISGNGNNGTITSGTFVYDSPMKARKASVNANMVKNGDFEYAPPFTAATANQTDRWIDGTSGGSTTNNLFGWKSAATSVYSGGTSYSMRYDTILSRSCIRIVSVGKIYKSGSIITQMGAYRTAYTASSLLESDRLNMIEVQPNTTYTLTGLYYINQCDAQVQPRVQAVEYNAALTRVATTTADTLQDTSVAWRTVTTRFTTSATSRYVSVAGVVLGIGADFTDGNCDVAFTGVSLTPVYPEGRVPANGNLVKNFDFEVAPTFVAATSTAGRWIDGTASGSTTNSTYKWAIASAALTASASASFDTTVFRNGTASLKLDRTDATGAVVVANVLNAAAGGSLGTIPINPGVSYTFNIYAKTSTVGTDTVYADVRLFNAAGSTVNTKSTNKLSGTNDWTLLTVTFTADADATNCCIILRNAASATVGPAWFDDIYLAPTTNPGRVVIT